MSGVLHTVQVLAAITVPEGYGYRNAIITEVNGSDPVFSPEGENIGEGWEVHFGTAQGAYFGCVDVLRMENGEWEAEWHPFIGD